jgi:hypothetical protein
LFFARSAKNSTPLILACRVVLRTIFAELNTIFACAANDFTVSHQTNSLPGNKLYVPPKEVFTSKIVTQKLNVILFFDLEFLNNFSEFYMKPVARG